MENCKHYLDGFCENRCSGANQLRLSRCHGCSEYCEESVSTESKQYYVRAGRLASETLVSLDTKGLEFARSAGYDIRPA